MVGAGDIAGATGAGTHAGGGFDHGADHLGVLAHAEVIVGAPHDHVAGAVRRMPDGAREAILGLHSSRADAGPRARGAMAPSRNGLWLNGALNTVSPIAATATFRSICGAPLRNRWAIRARC